MSECDNYRLYPRVELGPNPEIGDYVIIGVPPRGEVAGSLMTSIGAGAIIRSHSVIYAGNKIGAQFQSGHGVLIRECNEIGDYVSIGSHAVIEHHLRIGSGVRVHSCAFIPEFSILEDNSWVGPNAVFTNARYPRSPDAKCTRKGPHLRVGARVGANATLLPGVVIGAHALVGAGAVVVDDVPDGKVVVGNPGRVVRDVNELSAYQIDQIAMTKE